MQRMTSAFVLAAAVVAVPLAASAQPVSTVSRTDKTEAPVAASTGDPNRRICTSVTTTGSGLAKSRVCKTAREWSEQQHETKKGLERLQNTNRLSDIQG